MNFRNGPAALVLLLCCLGAAACGDDPDPTEPRDATLVLDFVPGPVHAGIYEAAAEGYYRDEGVDLEIVEPTSTADTLKLIEAGEADLGIADGIDVASQISDGRGAKGVMAIAQRPLGGLITRADSGFESPSDLEGGTVGITGVPSDEAVLDSMIEADGGDPGSVGKVTIGFNGVANLESGKVDGFTGFIPADGVQVEADGFPTRSFAPERYGDLTYPGLVMFSTEEAIAADPDLIQGVVAATVRGYGDVVADPEAGVDALLEANPAIPPEFARASLRAYMPFFTDADGDTGAFDEADLRKLSDFMVGSGLAETPIEPSRYATDEFVEGAG